MRASLASGASLLVLTLAAGSAAGDRAAQPGAPPTDADAPATVPGGAGDDGGRAGALAPLAEGPAIRFAYTGFGQDVGFGGIASAVVGGHTEIYTTAWGLHSGAYWYGLTREPASGDYGFAFVQPVSTGGQIWRLDVADVHPQPGPEIVLIRADGVIEVRAPETKQLLASFNSGVTWQTGFMSYWAPGLRFADLDGDGLDEIWCGGFFIVRAFRGTGEKLWETASLTQFELAVGQMDDDPGLEVATTQGRVIDVDTLSVQCQRPEGFVGPMAVSDVDGDGRRELVVAGSTNVRAYDVEMCGQKWSLAVGGSTNGRTAMAVTDVDGDGADELLVGAPGAGQIRAYSLATLQALWSIPSPLPDTRWVAALDADGDGDREVLWGGFVDDSASGGRSRLFVGDPATQAVVWQNQQIDGPFVGPLLGDVDGDGAPEIVTASPSTDGGEGSGRILVLDPQTLALKAMSPPVAGGAVYAGHVRDLELRNVDGDPALEIAVATDANLSGLIEVFDYGPDGAFDLAWSNATLPPSSVFHSVEIADLDGDGHLEVIGNLGNVSAFTDDVIYVYDYDTGAEVWHSERLALDYGATPRTLAAADSDGDGVAEIHALDHTGTLHVIDGVTHDEQALIGPFLGGFEVRPKPGSPLPYLWAHDGGAGQLTARRWNGTAYAERGAIALATAAPIAALTFGPRDSLYVAHEWGKLSFLPTLTSPAPAWTLSGWGQSFGRQVVSVKSASLLVTSGDFAVVAFEGP